MKKLRAIIVDDERLARKELRLMLAEFPNVDIVSEADSVAAAAKLVEQTKPDVVFLDVQMPGENGFELLEQIAASVKIVFVTAFDNHAVRAFEVNALDYLLKPVNPSRLKQTIERLTVDAPSEPLRKLEYDDRLFLEVNGRAQFLKINAISCVCATGDYSRVFTVEGQKTLVLKPLKEWEERLPERYFLRIHRSTIVNLEHIERIETGFNGAGTVFLRQHREPLAMSRRYAAQLRARFS